MAEEVDSDPRPLLGHESPIGECPTAGQEGFETYRWPLVSSSPLSPPHHPSLSPPYPPPIPSTLSNFLSLSLSTTPPQSIFLLAQVVICLPLSLPLLARLASPRCCLTPPPQHSTNPNLTNQRRDDSNSPLSLSQAFSAALPC